MKRMIMVLLLLRTLMAGAHEFHFRLLPTDYTGAIEHIRLLSQSSDKMMWLGTNAGLYAFDGRKYKYFARPDGQQIEVTAITEEKAGQMWVGYQDGLILILNYQGQMQNLQDDSISGTPIRKIVFHPGGRIFIATYGKGLWQYENRQLKRVSFGALADLTDIYDALVDSRGQLWCSTDNGIWIYEPLPVPKTRYLGKQQGLQDDIITQLDPDQNGNVLLGMYDYGVSMYQVTDHSIHELLRLDPAEGAVVKMDHGFRGEIWIATEKSIWIGSPGNPMHRIQLPDRLKARIESLLFDQSGNLWMACGNRLYIANTQLDYLHPGITGIQALLTSKDHLWIGCQQGFYSTDEEGHQLREYLRSYNINVLSLYQDGQGLLWIGTFGQGLYIFNPVTGKVRQLTERNQLSNTSILSIAGKDHDVWLATLGGITQIHWKQDPYEPNLQIREIQDEDQSPPGYVYEVFVSSNGRVWFGTDGKGLFYLENGGIHLFPIDLGDSAGRGTAVKTVYSITEDWEHRLWIAVSLGLVLCVDLDGKVIRRIETSPTATNGLALTGTEEVLLIREGSINCFNESGQMYTYDEASGLTNFAPISINANTVGEDGTVWIADADAILHYTSYNQFVIRQVKLQFEDVMPGAGTQKPSIVLKPDSNFLDIKFTGLWFQDPAQVRYRYKLQGHDQNWIYTREGRAVYSRLSAGTYTFLLQGSQNDDFSPSQTLQKIIQVLPPVYARWWFISGLMFIIGMGIYAFIRSRFRQLRKYHELEKEKTTLQLNAIQAQVNPHFLFNSFNTLSGIIEEDQPAAVAYVDQLSSFFRGALMHRDDELIPIQEEMEIVRNYVYILKKRYGNNIQIEEHIDPQVMGWVAPLTIQLLVENAIKHNTVSADRKLTIRIRIDTRWIEVSNPLQPKFQTMVESTGFGLSSLMTRYTYLTPLKIDIRKEQNRFTVRIPVITKENAA